MMRSHRRLFPRKKHQNEVTALHTNSTRHAHLFAPLSRQQHENQKDEQQANCQRKQAEKGIDTREDILGLLRTLHSLLLYLVDMQTRGEQDLQRMSNGVGEVDTIRATP